MVRILRKYYLTTAIIAVVSLTIAFIYGGFAALATAVLLSILEVSLSFDNAVVNARILKRMSHKWRVAFLYIGIIIAVFGMRIIMPLVIVMAVTGLNPVEVVQLAMAKGDPDTTGSYAWHLHHAHPQIAAFGGSFLLLLALTYLFQKRELTWLSTLERPLQRLERVPFLAYIVTAALIGGASLLAPDPAAVAIAGGLGIAIFFGVNWFAERMERLNEERGLMNADSPTELVGKAAFGLFMYLELIDASFSFDGVIGAFAITADPILIAIGLGLIGAFTVRSITIHFVEEDTLANFRYLEHGAHWGIAALALTLVVSIAVEVPEVVTAGTALIIVAAFIASVRANTADRTANAPTPAAAGN